MKRIAKLFYVVVGRILTMGDCWREVWCGALAKHAEVVRSVRATSFLWVLRGGT